MPLSALPIRLQLDENWKGTDDDVWYMKWRIPLKGLFSYGPRADEWWAKWREWPITVFAIRSKKGSFRTETEEYKRDSSREDYNNNTSFFMEDNVRLVFWQGKQREIVRGYLSAIQYWTKWHIQIQWPFFVAFHFYIDEVPVYPDHGENKRVLYFRFGARRDADKVFWFPSLYGGLRWN